METNPIISKLDEFIRKYYKNQLIKGSLYAVGLGLAFYLSAAAIEYFGRFSSSVRTVLFSAWILSTSFVIVRYIALPLSKLYKLGKIISYEQASAIIGDHFANVQDKLLNFLQLSGNKADIVSSDLWQASINQRIKELKPVPFTNAVDLKENRRYLKFVVIPASVLVFLLFAAPSVLSEGTERLVNFNTFYAKPAPFSFEIANKELKALQQEDFKMTVKIKGNETPAEVFIDFGDNMVKLEKENNSTFVYTFKNVQENTKFLLTANSVNSQDFELVAIPKPLLTDFKIQLDFPAYLGRKAEVVNNSGDLVIPQGTKVNWLFNTRNSDYVRMSFADTAFVLQAKEENKFSFSRKYMAGGLYGVKTGNSRIITNDSLSYSVNVIPDAYPAIEVSEQKDSLHPRNIYFSGSLKDDYGFSRFIFHYTKYSTDSTGIPSEKREQVAIGVAKNQIAQPFYHFFDLNQFDIQPGDKVEYYFEVWDNDGVNGAKAAKSAVMMFKAPTVDEINKQAGKNADQIEKDMESAIKSAKDLQKQINEMSRQVQEKKQLGWEEKKKLEDLIQKQNELKQKVEDIKKQNQQNNEMRNEFNKPNENLLEKQKELEKLMENIMTPEMKKLFDELQKMLEKMADKNKIQETLEKMKMTDKDLEKELDRNLELFKQMEVEQKLDQAIQKLDEIKNKQQELAEKSEDKKLSQKEIQQKQDELNKKLNDMKKQLEEAQKESQKATDENKKAEQDQKAQDLKDKMSELEKQKQELGQKNDDKKADAKELEKKQEELTKKFDDLKKDLKELDQKNKELENPNKMPDTQQQQQQASQDQQKAQDQLNQNDKKGASKSQKSAASEMEQISQMMTQAQQQMQQEEEGEDMAAMRQLLENLLNLSFAQEELIKQTQKAKLADPNYTKLGQKQQKLKDDAKMVEDSLLAISKRQPKVSASVNREINNIQMNMSKSISALEERSTPEAAGRMQNIMKSINDLALMLNESLDDMQKAAQKKGGSPGGGSCNKPGGQGQKPSMSNMRKMQEQLNKQMQAMKEAMEKGQKPGNKPGQKPGQQGMGGMPTSQDFAKMAAQQEALRKMMQDAMKNQKDGGKNPGGDMASKMEETENDLVNKMITQETMKRQQEIMTRLLESEKAEREREFDEKRESNEAKEQNNSNQKLFLEYKRQKEKELELLKTVPPSLTPYYKEKVSNYFNNFNNK